MFCLSELQQHLVTHSTEKWMISIYSTVSIHHMRCLGRGLLGACALCWWPRSEPLIEKPTWRTKVPRLQSETRNSWRWMDEGVSKSGTSDTTIIYVVWTQDYIRCIIKYLWRKMIYWISLYRSYQPINTPYILPTLYAMLYRLSRVLEEPVSSWNIWQLRSCDAVVFSCEYLRGMVRAEVNTISSHPHHWGTCYRLQGTGDALGHLWYFPPGRAALPFNIPWRGEEEEESFIGPTEGKCFPSLIIHTYIDTCSMDIYDKHMHNH